MNNNEEIKQRVCDAAKKFFAEHMSVRADSASVDIHNDCLVVTLHNAISKAETAYIQEKDSCGLLDKFYKDTFDASKLIFEAAVERVLTGGHITGSFMSLSPQSGKCVIVISICSDNKKQDYQE